MNLESVGKTGQFTYPCIKLGKSNILYFSAPLLQRLQLEMESPQVKFDYDRDEPTRVFVKLDDEEGLKISSNSSISSRYHTERLKSRFGDTTAEFYVDLNDTIEHEGKKLYRLSPMTKDLREKLIDSKFFDEDSKSEKKDWV